MTDMVALDVSYWNLLVTMVLPAGVALVNTRFAPGHVKALTLVALSIIGGVINQIIAQGGGFEVGKTLWYIAVTFAGAALVHFGLLAPLQVTGANGSIAKSVPGGLGPAGTDRVKVDAPAAPETPAKSTTATAPADVIVDDPYRSETDTR
jgi:hypothetical protein